MTDPGTMAFAVSAPAIEDSAAAPMAKTVKLNLLILHLPASPKEANIDQPMKAAPFPHFSVAPAHERINNT